MTPDQSIALWSVISGGAVGLAGVLLAGVSGWRDRRHAREMADMERRQRRLEETYLSMVHFTHRIGVAALAAVDQLGPDVVEEYAFTATALEFPSLEEQSALRAKVEVFGSTAVKDAYGDWHDSIEKIRRTNSMGREAKKLVTAGQGKHVSVLLEVLQDLRGHLLPASAASQNRLTDLVSKELA